MRETENLGIMRRRDHLGYLNSRDLRLLRRSLLAWYDQNRRDLPWRKTRDPYRVWVSEIMLQQTRVAAVLPRYETFLRRFPSIQKLAAAHESSVLAEWSGLGYYRRARNLRSAAKAIIQHHGGVFPQTAEAWLALPGIGRYTAAAIGSIAFGEPVAVLDGNVERVLRRVCSARGEQASWGAAEVLLDRTRPGDFNQAMMELGALVCLPERPLCSRCPIRRFCRFCASDQPARPAQRREKRRITYALVRSGDCVRLVRRPLDRGLMPGMWELPEVDAAEEKRPLFTVRHSITVTDYMVNVVAHPQSADEDGKWVRLSRLQKVPLTGLAKKILRRAQIIK